MPLTPDFTAVGLAYFAQAWFGGNQTDIHTELSELSEIPIIPNTCDSPLHHEQR